MDSRSGSRDHIVDSASGGFCEKKKKSPDVFEDVEGHEFEYFCADLLTDRGFTEVEVTKGSGDYGIDILAQKDGVTYAIQCKRYTAPVGVKAIQEAYAEEIIMTGWSGQS